jgi:long-subunit acyl-CoA synthetase (AMP-forming)
MVELTGKTLSQTFLEQATRRGEAAALREKEYGIWRRVTWRQYLDACP